MESSIQQAAFDELPVMYQARIRDLQQELLDGDITQKGYSKKITHIMEEYQASQGAVAPSSPMLPSDSRQVQFSEPSEARPDGVGGRTVKVDYSTRQSTAMGFKKPGINFDDLLGEFDDSDDSDDIVPTNISFRLQPNRTALGITADALERTSSNGSPAQRSGSSGKTTPRSGARTPYSVGGRVVDDIAWDSGWAPSGRADHVLDDMMDPLGQRAAQQAQFSDDSSVDEFDSIGPADFNPDQITKDAKHATSDIPAAAAGDVKRMNSLVYPRGRRTDKVQVGRAEKTRSKLYGIGEEVDFGDLPSSGDEGESRRTSAALSHGSLSSDKRDDSGIIQQQVSAAGSGIPTPKSAIVTPQLAGSAEMAVPRSPLGEDPGQGADQKFSRLSLASSGSESVLDAVSGSITLDDLARASNVDLTSMRESMVVPEQPTLAQLAAESAAQSPLEEDTLAIEADSPDSRGPAGGGMVVDNVVSQQLSSSSSIALGGDSSPVSGGLMVMNTVGDMSEDSASVQADGVESAMPRALSEYDPPGHTGSEGLADNDSQPNAGPVRRPTQTARLDRRPTTAGRMSYYLPEAEPEVPANFDMPSTPVPAIDTELVRAMTVRGTSQAAQTMQATPGPMTAPAEYEPWAGEPWAGEPALSAAAVGAVVEPRVVGDDAQSAQLRQLLGQHQTLASVLQHRAQTTPSGIAYTCIDTKGREIGSWTWQGLHVRAMHVVQVLRQQGVAAWGDRVALVYRKYEMLEFVGSLFGCFYAGLTAVPIVAGDSYAELVHVLNSTGAAVVLTTELNIRSLSKDLSQNSVGPGWPADVPWVRTDSLGGCVLSP
ncbi:hypothetical protein EC988_002720, partial [Linderina pennispora]